jgi:hypothetical protein
MIKPILFSHSIVLDIPTETQIGSCSFISSEKFNKKIVVDSKILSLDKIIYPNEKY